MEDVDSGSDVYWMSGAIRRKYRVGDLHSRIHRAFAMPERCAGSEGKLEKSA